MSLAHRPSRVLDSTDVWIIEAIDAFFAYDDVDGPCRFDLLVLEERLAALPTDGLSHEEREDQRHNALGAMLADYLPRHPS